MRKLRWILTMLILITTVVSSFHISYGNSVAIPKLVEIGLFFRSSAKSNVTLKSITGFNIGQYTDDTFNSILAFYDVDEIFLRKDSYYINNNGVFVEYTGDMANIPSNLSVEGPYHLQIGPNYQNVDEVRNAINTINLQEDKPYIVYEEGWRIFVGLYLNEAIAQEKATLYQQQLGLETKVIAPSATRVQAINKQGQPIFMFDSQQSIYFEAIEDKGGVPLITVEGTRFRGAITAKRITESDMTIINKLPLEEYLYGVVPREMPSSWPLEALKAQAVAARGYTVTTMKKYRSIGFDLCNTINSQVYGGYDVEVAATNRAVDETLGKILVYNGRAITPFYHSNSGGHTENSENIWSNVLPYIRGVKDEFSLGVPTATWNAVLTVEEIKELLLKQEINIGEVLDIKATEVSENGRVLKLIVHGTEGQEIMEKEKSRRVFGLRSTWYNVAPSSESFVSVYNNQTQMSTNMNLQNRAVISASGTKQLTNITNIAIYNGTSYKSIDAKPNAFVFDGKGYGHGLGMSQHGARKMAEMNYTYDQILMHYYTDSKVE